MAWLSLHIWMLLAAAALLGLFFGFAIRGLMLRGKLRRAEVERDMSALELEQAKTEIEALYAAQRRAGAPDEALQQQLREREEAVQRLGNELKSAKAELQQLSDGGGHAAMTGGAAIAGAAVGAVAGSAATGASDGENSQEQLEWRNRYLESRVRRLEEDLRNSNAPAEPSVGSAMASADSPVEADASEATEMDKLRWQNNYMRQRLSVFEDKAARASNVSSAQATKGSQQETPDEELARLRWRNRYLEGRLAYLEEGQAADNGPEAGAVTTAAAGSVAAVGAATATETVAQAVSEAASVEEVQDTPAAPEPAAEPEPDAFTNLTPPAVPSEEEAAGEPSDPVSTDAGGANDATEPVPVQSGEAEPAGLGPADAEPVESGAATVETAAEPLVEDAAPEDPAPVEQPSSLIEPAPPQHPADQMLRDLDAQDAETADEPGASDSESLAEEPPASPDVVAAETEPEIAGVDPVRPEGLASRPKDGGDDLTEIEGVGPRLQEVLNSLGIWHFEQIADWDEANASWIDQELNFSGRVARQDWVGQARRLLSQT